MLSSRWDVDGLALHQLDVAYCNIKAFAACSFSTAIC